MRVWTEQEVAELNKIIRIVRPKEGKPLIHCMLAATKDVDKALQEAGGWKDLGKLADKLKKKGYDVTVQGKTKASD